MTNPQRQTLNSTPLLSRPQLEAMSKTDALEHIPYVILPAPPFLMLSRIVSASAQGAVQDGGWTSQAELDLSPDLWFFQAHFKHYPVMPGALILEGMCQTFCGVGHAMKLSGQTEFNPSARLRGVDNLKFQHEVRPHHDVLTFKNTVTRFAAKGDAQILHVRATAEINGKIAASANPIRLVIVPS